MARQVGKKSISEDDRKGAVSRIKPAEEYDALSGCDLVIETAIEKEGVRARFSPTCALRLSRRDPGNEYVLDLDHTAGVIDGSP